MPYTTIQFRQDEMKQIKRKREALQKQLGINLTLAQTVLHMVNKQ